MPEIVTVSGLPGSGTTTLCRLLEEKTGLPYTYAGQIFREEAKARGLTLAEFGALCQDDPRVDRSLDERQLNLLKEAQSRDGMILEGRLAGWHAMKQTPKSLRIWLDCDMTTRMQRILQREGGDMAEKIQQTSERERSEADRYNRFYGIDMADMSPYDLVLDSNHTSPDELAQKVLDALRSD